MSSTGDKLDELLSIIGNETRRRILQLLAEEPRYLLQLARDIDVTQQAILKHLNILEKCGLVSCREIKSELAAPPRKYYELTKSFHISIGLTPTSVGFRARELSEEPAKAPLAKLNELEKKTQELEGVKEAGQALQLSDSILTEIDKQMEELEQAEAALYSLREHVAKKARSVIRECCGDLLERRLLYSLLGSGGHMDVERLSEELDIREKELERILRSLRSRLPLVFFER